MNRTDQIDTFEAERVKASRFGITLRLNCYGRIEADCQCEVCADSPFDEGDWAIYSGVTDSIMSVADLRGYVFTTDGEVYCESCYLAVSRDALSDLADELREINDRAEARLT